MKVAWNMLGQWIHLQMIWGFDNFSYTNLVAKSFLSSRKRVSQLFFSCGILSLVINLMVCIVTLMWEQSCLQF